MSYIVWRTKCQSCNAEWNSAFGVVGTMRLGHSVKNCPNCGSDDLKKVEEPPGSNEQKVMEPK